MNIRRVLIFYFALILTTGSISRCSKSTDPNPQYAVNIHTSATLGNILTDNAGNTLYIFANDFNGASSCSGSCQTTWPPFHLNEALAISSDLVKTDFSSITRADGSIQTTYKGWPLYYYAPSGKNEGPNLTTGQGVDGTWFVTKADYGIAYANTQLIGADGNHYKSDFTIGDGITKYFTDDHGRTIYLFGHDRNGVNTFTTATNLVTFPLFYADLDKISLPGTLLKSDFAVITVGTDSKKQLTYKGWPLYYAAADVNRGDNKAVSLPASGPLWRTVNANTVQATN